MTRRGGGVILQTASQHAFSSAKICNFSQKISDISPRFCKIQRILTIICVLPQFRQNSMKIAAKMTDLNENSAKFCKNHEKIAKINGAKDCKFEFRAVQRNANLVGTFGFLIFSLRGLRWTQTGYVEPGMCGFPSVNRPFQPSHWAQRLVLRARNSGFNVDSGFNVARDG